MPKIVEWAKRHWVWLVGGGAVIVAIIYFRNQAANAQAAAAPQPGPDQTTAGAVGASAPATNTAQSAYNDQLAQLQLQSGQEMLKEQQAMFGLAFQGQQQALALQNQQAQQQLGQQQQVFDIQKQIAQGELPSIIGAANAALGEQAAGANLGTAQEGALQNQIQKTGASCPGNASLRWNPQQGWYCREKTSGGILGIPVGQVVSAVGNFLGGVQAGAGGAGQQITQAAGAGAAQGVQSYIAGLFGAGNNPITYAQQGAAAGAITPTPATIPIQGNIAYSPAKQQPAGPIQQAQQAQQTVFV